MYNFKKEEKNMITFPKVMFLKQAIEDQWGYKGPSDFSSYNLAA